MKPGGVPSAAVCLLPLAAAVPCFPAAAACVRQRSTQVTPALPPPPPTLPCPAGVRELPDWGKLIFREQAARDLAAAVPGAPPEAVQLLSGLLQYNPDHRLTAKQALQSPYFRAEPLPAAPRVMLGIVKGALA